MHTASHLVNRKALVPPTGDIIDTIGATRATHALLPADQTAVSVSKQQRSKRSEAPHVALVSAEAQSLCIGDSSTWDGGNGQCDTYSQSYVPTIPTTPWTWSQYNYDFCYIDQDAAGDYAYQVCPQCGTCSAGTSPPAPPSSPQISPPPLPSSAPPPLRSSPPLPLHVRPSPAPQRRHHASSPSSSPSPSPSPSPSLYAS